jgi:hypothetical protein
MKKMLYLSIFFLAISHAEYIHTGDHYREIKHLDDDFAANSMVAFSPPEIR